MEENTQTQPDSSTGTTGDIDATFAEIDAEIEAVSSGVETTSANEDSLPSNPEGVKPTEESPPSEQPSENEVQDAKVEPEGKTTEESSTSNQIQDTPEFKQLKYDFKKRGERLGEVTKELSDLKKSKLSWEHEKENLQKQVDQLNEYLDAAGVDPATLQLAKAEADRAQLQSQLELQERLKEFEQQERDRIRQEEQQRLSQEKNVHMAHQIQLETVELKSKYPNLSQKALRNIYQTAALPDYQNMTLTQVANDIFQEFTPLVEPQVLQKHQPALTAPQTMSTQGSAPSPVKNDPVDFDEYHSQFMKELEAYL